MNSVAGSAFWNVTFVPMLDRRLPHWARRSNPLVRRHLGIHWKILPLESGLLARIILAQAALLALSVLVPLLLPLIFTLLPVAFVLLPVIFALYARLLLRVGFFTVQLVVEEQRDNTLTLLRTTPMSLRQILYSKAAAGVWRQVEDLGLIIMAASLLSLPIIGLIYAQYWPFEDHSLVSRVTLMLGLLSALLRLMLEPLMVAALALATGALAPVRVHANLAIGGQIFFYFLLINMPRLLELSAPWRIILELLLPLALPALIALGALQLAQRLLTRDRAT
ncbi:MAG: hypothetical protein J4G17_01070 [Anaerolineae bacterium]|nr:hypothetical protein [Anaerolineae bacterium]